ncbi:hypothetical protein [Lentibacillus sp. CBA3610]|uniref:primosomal protein N' family DNA-binding protein n=1 Tax=Lentibacillus sp. CBA3610 TaxID=2518176 RepID=UPI0020D212E4|nr:hypothetical protein [Lentibacillus sp. CBA3610]
MNIAKVIVDVPASSINQTFDYRIPERFQEMLQPGMRVIVPFGPRKIMGYVVERVSESSFDHLKDISDILDLTPILTGECWILGKMAGRGDIKFVYYRLSGHAPQVLKAKL